MYKAKHISVIVPAYNEALAISSVLIDLKNLKNTDGTAVFDRIILSDNASTDDTAKIASAHNIQIVYEQQPGYGSACQKALAAISQTDIILFVDADASVKIDESFLLLDRIISGYGLVIGNRVPALREPHALHWQQILGTQLACKFINFLYKTRVSDLGPFRAIRFSELKAFDMQDQRFGWTAEMQVKAIQNNVQIVEVPVSVKTRIGKSKISGTLRGTVLAGYDILSTIWQLWKTHKKSQKNFNLMKS